MKVHYVKAMISRDPMTVIPVCVPATAIPILQMVHGGKVAEVKVQDEFIEMEAEDEFDRLGRVYGERPNTGKTYAEEIYGSANGLEQRMFIKEPANDEPQPTDDVDPADADDIFGAAEEPVVPKKRNSRA